MPLTHWLSVALSDRRGNRHGIGSRIVLRQGTTTQTRWIFGGGSFQSASAPVAHFGLADGAPVALEVTWSDGTVQRVEKVTVDRATTVERGPR